MIPGPSRLRNRRDFQRLYTHGRFVAALAVTVHSYRREDSGPARIGVVIGRRFGCNARRNYWKRLLKAACRPLLDRLRNGYDIVLIGRERMGRMRPADIIAEVTELIDQCGLCVRMDS